MRERSFTALPNPMSQPNTVTYQASSSEAVCEVVALKDGGYSDWVYLYWGEGTTALQGRAATRRPPSVSTQIQSPIISSNLRKGADR